jgi:DNA-binding HxlR family transcriptional regulator
MKKENLRKCDEGRENAPITDVLSRLGDKWSMCTVIMLADHGTLRFNELHHMIGTISEKMLTVTLKTLESDGMVTRTLYPQVPPKVEYNLTALGQTLVPHLFALYDWANAKMPEIKASRERFTRPVS